MCTYNILGNKIHNWTTICKQVIFHKVLNNSAKNKRYRAEKNFFMVTNIKLHRLTQKQKQAHNKEAYSKIVVGSMDGQGRRAAVSAAYRRVWKHVSGSAVAVIGPAFSGSFLHEPYRSPFLHSGTVWCLQWHNTTCIKWILANGEGKHFIITGN